MAPLDVWIDTDPAIGVPGSDVDDGLALIQAFHSPELLVHGVSVVFGNTTLARAVPIAREVCGRFGPSGLPVRSGAASREQLGDETDAVRALATALEERPLHVLALGPMTNVASVLQRRPELAGRIESLVMVAARRPEQAFRSVPEQSDPFPDFNFECDPEAMAVVLASACPLVFAPWEVSSHVWMTPEDLDRLGEGSASGAYVADRSRHWLGIWRDGFGAPGFNPFDTLAVAWLTHPEQLQHFDAAVAIETGPHDGVGRGDERLPQGDTKPYLVVREQAGGRRALYCHEPTADFKPTLLRRLVAREPGPSS